MNGCVSEPGGVFASEAQGVWRENRVSLSVAASLDALSPVKLSESVVRASGGSGGGGCGNGAGGGGGGDGDGGAA